MNSVKAILGSSSVRTILGSSTKIVGPLLQRQLSTYPVLPESDRLTRLENTIYPHISEGLDNVLEASKFVAPCDLRDKLNEIVLPCLQDAAANGFAYVEFVKGVMSDIKEGRMMVSVGGTKWSTETMEPLSSFTRLVIEDNPNYVIAQAELKAYDMGYETMKKSCRRKEGIIKHGLIMIDESLLDASKEFGGSGKGFADVLVSEAADELSSVGRAEVKKFLSDGRNIKIKYLPCKKLFLAEAWAWYPLITRDKHPKKFLDFGRKPKFG